MAPPQNYNLIQGWIISKSNQKCSHDALPLVRSFRVANNSWYLCLCLHVQKVQAASQKSDCSRKHFDPNFKRIFMLFGLFLKNEFIPISLASQIVNAAAAAKSLQSDSVRPHRQQPIRLPSPWDSPGKNTGMGCHFLLQCMKVKSESEVAQLCPTLSDPMDCSLPGSSVHGIFQARVLEWGAIAFSYRGVGMSKIGKAK